MGGLSQSRRQGAQRFINQAGFNSGVSLAAPDPKAAPVSKAAAPASVGGDGGVIPAVPESKGKGKGKGAAALGYQKPKKAPRSFVPYIITYIYIIFSFKLFSICVMMFNTPKFHINISTFQIVLI